MASKLALSLLLAFLGLGTFLIGANAACNANWVNALAPCVQATMSTAYPGDQCCNSLRQNYNGRPDCLCQDMLTARSSGFNFNINNALSIPKRCGATNQIPNGYKCGGYTVGH